MFITIFCGLGCYYIFKKFYGKFTDLYNFVGSQNYTGIERYLVSMELLLKMGYLAMVQYMNKTITKIDENTYELTYMLEGKLYIHKITVNRNPTNFFKAIDPNTNENITSIINMYAGPDKTFINKTICPQYLGHKSILMSYITSSDKLFQENEMLESE